MLAHANLIQLMLILQKLQCFSVLRERKGSLTRFCPALHRDCSFPGSFYSFPSVRHKWLSYRIKLYTWRTNMHCGWVSAGVRFVFRGRFFLQFKARHFMCVCVWICVRQSEKSKKANLIGSVGAIEKCGLLAIKNDDDVPIKCTLCSNVSLLPYRL